MKGKNFEEEKEKNFFGMIIDSLKKGEKCFVFMPYKEGRKEKKETSKECLRGVLPLTSYICDKLGFQTRQPILFGHMELCQFLLDYIYH